MLAFPQYPASIPGGYAIKKMYSFPWSKNCCMFVAKDTYPCYCIVAGCCGAGTIFFTGFVDCKKVKTALMSASVN